MYITNVIFFYCIIKNIKRGKQILNKMLVNRKTKEKGMTIIELVIGLTLLTLVLMGLMPVFTNVMKSTVRDRWDTLATQRAEELIETIKRVASTNSGYATGDTDNSGGIDTANYREIQIGPDNTYNDPFNPILLTASTEGVRGNRRYSVTTTVIGAFSYKTILVWVEPIGSDLLRSVTIETIVSEP